MSLQKECIKFYYEGEERDESEGQTQREECRSDCSVC